MKIVFVEPLGVNEVLLQKTKDHFERSGNEFVYYTGRNESPDEIVRRAEDADVLTISNIPVTSGIIERCKNLKLINVAFTGVDHIDLDACKKYGISVCNASGYATIAVMELTMGVTLSLLRNIPKMDSETRELKGRNNYLGTELYGKTVGVVGTGAIGLSVAQMFFNFGCKIIAYSRTKKPLGFISYLPLDEVFSGADIISLHLPATKETVGLIGIELLSKMKPEAVIINTARGQIIDYNVLANLLKDGKIAGAGIDVYEMEPPLPEDHPILSAPNTVLLPHIGYATKEAMIKRLDIVRDNIDSFINGNLQNKII
ncbi:MAG: hydroxyacid dehydrogenase [Bacteroidales bacterium]|jgi:D-3-phosphoglycerate dehydrogenase|nr:hydroxyacid dehydrogenase [Bacteroidales bacterium]